MGIPKGDDLWRGLVRGAPENAGCAADDHQASAAKCLDTNFTNGHEWECARRGRQARQAGRLRSLFNLRPASSR
jgi:hypothetical protein